MICQNWIEILSVGVQKEIKYNVRFAVEGRRYMYVKAEENKIFYFNNMTLDLKTRFLLQSCATRRYFKIS